MTVLADLAELLFPSRCIICQRFPKPICDDCWQAQYFESRVVSRGDQVGVSICEYGGDIAKLLISFKEHGQLALGRRLGEQLAASVAKIEADLLVFAPSATNRGFVPAEIIATELARSWRMPVGKLRLRRGAKDQSKLRRESRLENLLGRMWSPRPLNGKRVVLVDDIVTTGATMREMARAVGAAGGHVLGFVTVAEAISKSLTIPTKKV